VLYIRRDGFVSKLDEIDDVRADDRPPFARRVPELATIVELGVADLLGACCVHAALAKEFGNARRQGLIEVDPHRVKRTSPGYRVPIVSGVSADFASIVS
jgi:hypothetical protein